jgi:WD40 repeat protein
MIVSRSYFALLVLMAVLRPVAAEPIPQSKKTGESGQISYYRDIRRIFQQHCQGCHQPAKAQGGYVMTNHAALLEKTASGEPGLLPGKPESSLLVSQITVHDGKPPAMPKARDPLSNHDVDLIKKWIAAGAKDDTPASAREVADTEHPPQYTLPPVITSLDYSPDGNILAVSGYHEVLLHSADGSSLLGRLIGLSERIESVAFSPDGKLLAATGGDPGRFGEVQIWDVARTKLKLSVPATFDTIYGASWSPDGTKVAFGCTDNTLRAIDAKTGKQVLYQGAHSDWVLNTVFSADGSHLVSVSRDRSMKLIEVPTQRFVDNITSITPGALKGGLIALARRPKTDELLAGGADGVPKIYRMHRQKKRVIGDDFNLIRAFEPMPGRIFSTRFSAEGNRLVAGSSFEGRGYARVYQVADGKLISTLSGQRGGVFCVAYRPDGREVASAGFDGVVRINDPETGTLLREFIPVPITASDLARGGNVQSYPVLVITD